MNRKMVYHIYNKVKKIYNRYRGIYWTNLECLKLVFHEREFYLENIKLANDLEIEHLRYYHRAQKIAHYSYNKGNSLKTIL